MSIIKILPESLANQIAAGEVVERPASVVKELVENSLDAGASQIAVHLEGDGTRLLRIIDNGGGMDEDDVLLCLERHATSKIRAIEELQRISTLGFRGEAIPSIASVARLVITSRVRTASLGTRAEVNFGRVVRVHECGCPVGTTIEVRDLFGNVPARKKFLRSARTELLHAEETVRNYALAYPAVGFSLSVNDQTVLELPAGAGDLAGRAHLFFCRPGRDQLIEVREGEDEGGPRVQGFLVPPDLAEAGSARLRFFVNGRAVRDRMMSQAVSEGLQGFLMKGRKPSGVFFVTVPPDAVDVNVHPTKQEVRFRRNSEVHSALAGAVRRALASYQGLLRSQWFGRPDDHGGPGQSSPGRSEGPPGMERLETGEPVPAYPKKTQPAPAVTAGRTAAGQPVKAAAQERIPGVFRDAAGVTGDGLPLELRAEGKTAATTGGPAVGAGQGKAGAAAGRGGLRFLGQLLATYLLCESEEGLLAIDQHAAHERLLFETLRRQIAGQALPGQALLFPVVVEFAPETLRLVGECREPLTRLGISLQEFGGASCLIKAVPAILAHLPPAETVTEVVGHLEKTGGKTFSPPVLDAILSTMACKAAIKAGQRLDPPEAEELLRQMLAADIFSHCPHGRPVARHFPRAEVSRWFHRG